VFSYGVETMTVSTVEESCFVESENSIDSYFNYHSIVPHEFIPAGQTVNQAYYLEVLRHAKDVVQRMCLEI
jgi:hypothetical protein